MKNHKIANKSATTEAREKISTYLVYLEFYNFFENYQILLYKISHRFLMTTKLFSGWKNLIAAIKCLFKKWNGLAINMNYFNFLKWNLRAEHLINLYQELIDHTIIGKKVIDINAGKQLP